MIQIFLNSADFNDLVVGKSVFKHTKFGVVDISLPDHISFADMRDAIERAIDSKFPSKRKVVATGDDD